MNLNVTPHEKCHSNWKFSFNNKIDFFFSFTFRLIWWCESGENRVECVTMWVREIDATCIFSLFYNKLIGHVNGVVVWKKYWKEITFFEFQIRYVWMVKLMLNERNKGIHGLRDSFCSFFRTIITRRTVMMMMRTSTDAFVVNQIIFDNKRGQINKNKW